MEDWKSPSTAKENMAAGNLKASLGGTFGEPSWDGLLISCAGAWLASRGVCSSRELDVMIVVRGPVTNKTSTTRDFAARRRLMRNE
jgi:hypothetical protein